jgi:hypothetical protein
MELGKAFKETYRDMLSPIYNGSHIQSNFSKIPRTRDSLMSFYYGIYPEVFDNNTANLFLQQPTIPLPINPNISIYENRTDRLFRLDGYCPYYNHLKEKRNKAINPLL